MKRIKRQKRLAAWIVILILCVSNIQIYAEESADPNQIAEDTGTGSLDGDNLNKNDGTDGSQTDNSANDESQGTDDEPKEQAESETTDESQNDGDENGGEMNGNIAGDALESEGVLSAAVLSSGDWPSGCSNTKITNFPGTIEGINIDETTSKLIYQTNTTDKQFMESKIVFPTEITVQYGETLAEAELKGQTGAGTYSFAEEDLSYVPTAEDVYKKYFIMTYTPADSRLKSITKKVCVTGMIPREITVDIDDKEMVYANALPDLTFTISSGQLADGDTADGLNIELSIDKKDSEKLSVGTWDIIADTANTPNSMYHVSIGKKGTLNVSKRLLDVTWSDITNIVYGQPDAETWKKVGANVTAEISNVVKEDKCTAVVTGGDKKQASWHGISGETPVKYTATLSLSGNDKDNYELPADKRTKKYYIRRADPNDFVLPDTATVIYGQTLADAVLQGASGDGAFEFLVKDTQQDATDQQPGDVSESPYTYTIRFTPSDSSYRPETAEIQVYVLPKAVRVTADDAKKTYGEAAPNYTFDKSAVLAQLENGDSPDSLAVTLNAGNGDSTEAPAGTYAITGTAVGNQNYAVTVVPAVLTVDKREAALSWTPADDNSEGKPVFAYTGQPVNVSAHVENLAQDTDDCQVRVVNGNRTNAGAYRAVAVRLLGTAAGNYKLPQNGLTKEYIIQQTDPVITAWPAASLTFGQTLEEAVLDGGDSQGVAGTFRFVENESLKMPNTADSGQTAYTMEFVPDDTANYRTVKNDTITVTVNRKPIQVQINSAQKIYGDEWNPSSVSYSYNKSDTVGDDEIYINPHIYDGDDELKDMVSLAVATYAIGDRTANQNNPDYDVQITEGSLNVLPKEVELKWSDTINIVYERPDEETWNSVGANVTATISNLVGNDKCAVKVDGGDEKEASYQISSNEINLYHARAVELTGADSYNYIFADEEPKAPYDDYENSRIKPYVIRRANEDYILPRAVVLTYGKTLGEISNDNMIGASGEGTFTLIKDGEELTEDESKKILTAGEHSGYKVQFVPKDPNKKSGIGDINVIVVKARIIVTADNQEKTYGGKSPAYTIQVSGGKLAGKDKAEDLMTLKAVQYTYEEQNGVQTVIKEESGDEQNSPAGSYDIVMDEQKNLNYRITLLPGQLNIHPRVVDVAWSDISNLVYTGAPVNVTAAAANLVTGDTCNLTVIGGDRINAGTYHAWVTSVDNPNYSIPKAENRIVKYTIQKAAPNVEFPAKVTVKKGDVLGGAYYEASADIPGTFEFELAETIITQDGSYNMIFTPDDTNNYLTAELPVDVVIWKAADEDDDNGGGENGGGESGNIPDTDSGNIPDTDSGNIPDADSGNIPDADSGNGNNDSSNQTAVKAGNANTSDPVNMRLYIIILALSSGAVCVSLILKHKKR